MADLLVLVLRVLPGQIREWLIAEQNPSETRKEGAVTSKSACKDRGSG